MILSEANFYRYQDKFFKTIMASPYRVNLLTVEPSTAGETSDEAGFDQFVGDSPRLGNILNTFTCLYDKITNPQKREKYGVTETVNGVLFLSPRQLMPVYNTFAIDIKLTKAQFEGRQQVISKIVYMESVYNSCVAVQLAIEDDLKGGS